ncbi:MAG TPA: L-serine ammonia-lyase [Propionibacteriaceae bacterium]|nr:L-serine ammonia-lyase [Propionibacteriaceae bacterium]
MALSVFDLFRVGIGPSSSHTVGPMKAARRFVDALAGDAGPQTVARVKVELFGSLGATGHGHGSVAAVVLGLAGHDPETVDLELTGSVLDECRRSHTLQLATGSRIGFDPDHDVVLYRRRSLPVHPNGMIFTATDGAGTVLSQRTYYSVGGGFVLDDEQTGPNRIVADTTALPYPFASGAELLTHCAETGFSVARLMRQNERVWRSDDEIDAGLLNIWQVMQACIHRGMNTEGMLPGGLHVPRRAPELLHRLQAATDTDDPLRGLDWITLYALAVNEENAAGGRVVTAPTNGAAGVVPAVIMYYRRFTPGADDAGVLRFLLSAGAIGVVIKELASISGAEVGCQGEIGAACSMAAAGLAAALGGTPGQVENAAEIGMEHNLGLTCDPVGGLVQIPCIERNAIAAVKAVTAARTALRGDGHHIVSLDSVLKTMRQTGADMSVKYKETARAGLAVNVIEC